MVQTIPRIYGIPELDRVVIDLYRSINRIKKSLHGSATYKHAESRQKKSYANDMLKLISSSEEINNALELFAAYMPSSVQMREPLMRHYNALLYHGMGDVLAEQFKPQRYLIVEGKTSLGKVYKFQRLMEDPQEFVTESQIDLLLHEHHDEIFAALRSLSPTPSKLEIISASNQVRFYPEKSLVSAHSKKLGIILDSEYKFVPYQDSGNWLAIFNTRLKRSSRDAAKLIGYLLGYRISPPDDQNGGRIAVPKESLYNLLDYLHTHSLHTHSIPFDVEYRPLTPQQIEKMIHEQGCNRKTLEERSEGIIKLPLAYNPSTYAQILSQANSAINLLSEREAFTSEEDYQLLKAKALPRIVVNHTLRCGGVAFESILLTKEFYHFDLTGLPHYVHMSKRAQGWGGWLEKNNLVPVERHFAELFKDSFFSVYFTKELN